jgi:YD repeat-containing protein
LPLKSGGEMSLKWNLFAMAGDDFLPVSPDSWFPAGRGSMFSFLPYRHSGTGIFATAHGSNGSIRYRQMWSPGTTVYYEPATPLSWRARGNTSLKYFTEYNPENRVYYQYGDVGYPNRQGRILRSYDRNGNQLTYVYSDRVGSPSGYQLLRKIVGDTASVVPYFQYLLDGFSREAGPAPIHKIYLMDRVTHRDRSIYYDYQDAFTQTNTLLRRITYPGGCSTYFGLADSTDPSDYGHIVSKVAIRKEVDAENYATYFEYTGTPFKKIRKTVEPGNRTTYYTYDEYYEKTIVVQEGRATYFIYDIMSNDATLMHRMDNGPQLGLTYYTYDPNKVLVTQALDALGHSDDMDYNEQLSLTVQEDAIGATTYYFYDAPGFDLHKMLGPRNVPGTYSVVAYYEYDVNRNRTATTDALGNRTATGRDALGRIRKTVDANNNATYFNFGSLYGFLYSTVDPNNQAAYFDYDGFNAKLREVSPRWREAGAYRGFTTYHEYTVRNQLRKTIDALNNSTYFDYTSRKMLADTIDPRGVGVFQTYNEINKLRKVAITTAAGAVMASQYFEYDRYKNKVAKVDANGNRTYFIYDALDRSMAVRDAMFNQTYYGYNAVGNVVLVRNVRGSATTTTFDAVNRVSLVTDALNGQTYYGYDLAGNMVKQRDTLNNLTQRTFDALNRRTLFTDALSGNTYYGYDAVGNPVKLRDARNNLTQQTFDLLNRKTLVIDPLSNQTYYGYDAVGNVVKLRDARNNFTQQTFDALNRRTLVTDALNGQTYYGYDAVGNQVKLRDTRNSLTQQTFDALNRRTLVTDPLTNKTYYGYDAVGNQVKLRDGRNNLTQQTFDSLNRRTLVTDPLSNKTYFGYDAVGNRVKLRDGRNNLTQQTFDSLNRKTLVIDPLSNMTYFGYDAVGNRVKLCDARNNLTQQTFDVLNRVNLVTNALNGQTYFGYDVVGNVVKMRDPLGAGIFMEFDALNRRTTVSDQAGDKTYYGYNAVGNVVKLRDARNNLTQRTFDALNRPIMVTDAASGQTYFGYDAMGNMVKQRPPLNNLTQQTFDALNRITLVTDPLSNKTYFGYDAVGNWAKLRNGLNHLTQWTYDAANRMVAEVNGANETTYYGYDAANNLAQVRNALMNKTYYVYDARNQIIKVANPLWQTAYFAYDAVGNTHRQLDPLINATYFDYDALNRLSRRVDALGNMTYFSYDGASRLTRLVMRSAAGATVVNSPVSYEWATGRKHYGTCNNGSDSAYFAYDANGNMTGVSRASDGVTLLTQRFDALNRLTKKNWRADACYFEYDKDSNLTGLVYPRGNSRAYYVYDVADRLRKMRNPSNRNTYYIYNAASNVQKIRQGNTTVGYFSFDNAERVTSIRHFTSAGKGIAYFDYVRDGMGRIRKISREKNVAIYYTYDTADRLTKELRLRKSTKAQNYAFIYTYDAAGNRTKLARQFGAGVVWDTAYYRYNALNAPVKRFVMPANETTYYNYNGAGSLRLHNQASSKTYFEYDQANGLVSRIVPPTGNPWDIRYDSLLNRTVIVKAGIPSYYTWSGLNQLEERSAAGTLVTRYVHGKSMVPGTGGVTEVQRITATTTYYQYLHLDHQGTVHAITDENQATRAIYTPDAFGRLIGPVTGTTPNSPNDLQFQSNWLTFTIGTKRWCLSPSRIYDPELGTFLQADPLPMFNVIRRQNQKIALGVFEGTVFSREISRVSGLDNTHAKRYNPRLGKFARRDAIGYKNGGGLYGAYYVPNSLDPLGLIEYEYSYKWLRTFENIYDFNEKVQEYFLGKKYGECIECFWNVWEEYQVTYRKGQRIQKYDEYIQRRRNATKWGWLNFITGAEADCSEAGLMVASPTYLAIGSTLTSVAAPSSALADIGIASTAVGGTVAVGDAAILGLHIGSRLYIDLSEEKEWEWDGETLYLLISDTTVNVRNETVVEKREESTESCTP